MKNIIILLLSLAACKEAVKDEGSQRYTQTTQSSAVQTTAAQVEGKIHNVVATQPVFPGGVSNMYSFIGKNLQYPQEAIEKQVEGKVFIKFVVTKAGEIADVTVLRGIGFGCDEAARNVILSMPKWVPGENKGKKVNVYYTMPITFKLNS